ncbi:putative nucleotidyltransferase, Ribonuclease H [Helianthus annuus]|nr:putative nucleotidyltransferase, Ribonuclease H [Helianthus annuus]
MMSQMMANFPWQHFINQVLATQGNHGNCNNVGTRPEEDLAKPYKPSNLSCFSRQIADYDFQSKIKMPAHIRTYDGTEDPEDHLQIFIGAARIEKWSNAECCLMFMQTLVGSARIWFNDLPAQSIQSFDDLSRGFLANFSQQRRYVKEVHEGICGAHFGARSVVAKLMNLGYFWPSMHRDTVEQLKKCDACQIHSPIPKSPKHDLVPITSAWPFHKWGMDIVGPFPPSKGGVKFLLVAIDYFSKWPEVKPLAKITGKQVIDFVWENIICRYGLPGVIVTDNGKQFAEKPFSLWCKEYRINQIFSLVAYPQSNGQVERTNRSIVEGIKTRLERYESNWLEELPSVLWAIRTTEKTSHKKTPYSLVFGSEAVIPAEIGVVTQRIVNMDPEVNQQETMLNLQLLEEARDQAAIQEAKYKQKMEAYYNKKVKNERFKPGDLVLRNNEASKKENQGKLGPKWEGPYTILEAHKGGSYKLADSEGKRLQRHWNGKTLRKLYV